MGAMALVLAAVGDVVVEQQHEQPQLYVIPNRRSETFLASTLDDIHQSKYNYALFLLQMQRERKIRFARLCYTRQAGHYYCGQQEAFYCDRRVIEQNQKRHKGLVHCEPVLQKAKWRDVTEDERARPYEPQGFLCPRAFREEAVVRAADADWVPLQTLKSVYHEFLIVDYTAHLRAQLERHYKKRSAYFIYACTGGNSNVKDQDWAALYQLESLAVRCAVVARRDFARQVQQCSADCTDATITHLTSHYHPCTGAC